MKLNKVWLLMALLVGVGSIFFIMKTTQATRGFKPVPAAQLDQRLKSQYPEFYKTIANNKGTLTANHLIGVPGLGGARSVGQTKQWQYTTNMTPQSLTLNDKYIFVSAYDHTKQLNSVLFVIDRKTHQQIKTIALPTRAHVGGITIDDCTQPLYLSADSQGVTKLGRIQISKLVKSKKDPILTRFDDVITLADIKTAATIEYYQDAIWVGTFSANKNGLIQRFPINRTTNTLLTDPDGQAPTGNLNRDTKLQTANGHIQGINFYHGNLYITFSYGKQPAAMMRYQYDATTNEFTYAGTMAQLPPYLEGIDFQGDNIWLIFESGAKAYRKKTPIIVDRILQTDISNFEFK